MAARAEEAGVAVERRFMTADELARLPDDGMRHELVRGELRTMSPPGWQHGKFSIKVAVSLTNYVEPRGWGQVVGEVGFRLTSDPDTVRVPDAAFVAGERIPATDEPTGYWLGAPDLVVEVISPNDIYKDVEQKVAEWLGYGARLVFVVNPRRRTVAVHRPNEPVRTLTEDDVLSGEDVVPGWSLPVRAFFT